MIASFGRMRCVTAFCHVKKDDVYHSRRFLAAKFWQAAYDMGVDGCDGDLFDSVQPLSLPPLLFAGDASHERRPHANAFVQPAC